MIGTDETWEYIGSDVEDDGSTMERSSTSFMEGERKLTEKGSSHRGRRKVGCKIQPSCNGDGGYAGKKK